MVVNFFYIFSDMVFILELEVRKYEFYLVFDGGVDGLDCIRFLVEIVLLYLVFGGVWLVEMMVG